MAIRRVPKNPFDDDEAFAKPRSKAVVRSSVHDDDDFYSYSSSKVKADEFVNQQAVVDLENQAVQKSQETTSTLRHSLQVANDTIAVGAQTLISLHEQGVQIDRTHEKAVDLDQHLSRLRRGLRTVHNQEDFHLEILGERSFWAVWEVFSKGWKPKKTKKITGPMVGRVDHAHKERSEDREALGLKGSNGLKNERSGSNHDSETFQAERETQDDLLDEVSNVLDHIKELSMDMDTGIDRQAPATEHLHDDVHELNGRIDGANVRGQRLLRR